LETLDKATYFRAYYECAFFDVLTSNTHCIYITLRLLLLTTQIFLSRSTMQQQEGEETMLGAHEQRSEVARLLAQISAEYEAAQRGLSGLAFGTSQHEFITARMEHMGQLHSELHSLVGDIAIAMIADELNATD